MATFIAIIERCWQHNPSEVRQPFIFQLLIRYFSQRLLAQELVHHFGMLLVAVQGGDNTDMPDLVEETTGPQSEFLLTMATIPLEHSNMIGGGAFGSGIFFDLFGMRPSSHPFSSCSAPCKDSRTRCCNQERPPVRIF